MYNSLLTEFSNLSDVCILMCLKNNTVIKIFAFEI
jgi:hypothetical protein